MVDHITCPPYGPYNFSSLSVSLKSFFLLSSLKPNPKHHGRALRAQTPSPTLSHSQGRIPAPRSRLLLEPLLIVLICDDTTTNNGSFCFLSIFCSLFFFFFMFIFYLGIWILGLSLLLVWKKMDFCIWPKVHHLETRRDCLERWKWVEDLPKNIVLSNLWQSIRMY